MRIRYWSSDVCSSYLVFQRERCADFNTVQHVFDVAAIHCFGGVDFGMQARSGALSDDVFPRNTSRSGCARLLCRKECPQRPASCANAEIGYRAGHDIDRKSVGEGKSVSVRVDLGGRRIIKKKKKRSN